MRSRTTSYFSLSLALTVCTFLEPAGGLTVYRVGGSFPDELQQQGVDVVHLSWEEASSGYSGVSTMIEVDEGAMSPVFLEPDRNIARDALKLGLGPFGSKWPVRTTGAALEKAVDGDPTTAFEERVVLENRDWPVIGVEFAGLLPLNRIVFFPTTQNQDRYAEFFELFGYAGEKSRLVDPWSMLRSYDVIAVDDRNRVPRVEVTMPTQLLHTLILMFDRETTVENRAYTAAARPWEVAEFEIYGDGFAPVAEYHSQILNLGATSSLGDIRWGGDKARDARVQIRTRSGSDDDPLRYWRQTGRGNEISHRDNQGNLLTRSQYQALSPTQRGGETHDVDSWSFWSAPYSFADSTGTPFRADRPGQFVQFQIDFTSIAHSGSELTYLEFESTSPPVVRDVVGEVSPVLAVAGEETEFVFVFRPSFSTGEGESESGFDRFILDTAGELTGVDSVRVNEELIPCQLLVDASPVACDRLVEPGSLIEFALPRMDVKDSGKTVELFFRARIFRFGTVFDGLLLDSNRPQEVGRYVVGGDANFVLESNQLSVGVDLSSDLLQDVGVSNAVVTPNGDGVNDEVAFQYTLLQLASGQSVTVDVYDLNGRRVRRVHEGMEASGRRERRWDGRGETGPLSPGIYIYRIRVDADAREAERSGLISVVY